MSQALTEPRRPGRNRRVAVSFDSVPPYQSQTAQYQALMQNDFPTTVQNDFQTSVQNGFATSGMHLGSQYWSTPDQAFAQYSGIASMPYVPSYDPNPYIGQMADPNWYITQPTYGQPSSSAGTYVMPMDNMGMAGGETLPDTPNFFDDAEWLQFLATVPMELPTMDEDQDPPQRVIDDYNINVNIHPEFTQDNGNFLINPENMAPDYFNFDPYMSIELENLVQPTHNIQTAMPSAETSFAEPSSIRGSTATRSSTPSRRQTRQRTPHGISRLARLTNNGSAIPARLTNNRGAIRKRPPRRKGAPRLTEQVKDDLVTFREGTDWNETTLGKRMKKELGDGEHEEVNDYVDDIVGGSLEDSEIQAVLGNVANF